MSATVQPDHDQTHGSSLVHESGPSTLTLPSRKDQVCFNESPTKKPVSLGVPSLSVSRLSFDSTSYSDISELSFHSNELQTRQLLTRSLPVEDPPGRGHSRVISALYAIYAKNYGAFLVMLAMMFGSLMNISARLLETSGSHGSAMHPFQILFARQSITATLCTAYALYFRSIAEFPLGPRDLRWLLAVRGLTGFFGIIGLYCSLLYLPLSEATVLTFLAPILTCYLCSYTIPGQTFTRQQQLAGFLSLIGVVFIARPGSLFSSSVSSPTSAAETTAKTSDLPRLLNSTFSSNFSTDTLSENQQTPAQQHLFAVIMAMVGVLGGTGAMTSIRAIGTRVHPLISINYFSFWCTTVSLVCLITFPEVKFRLPANLSEWGLLSTLGICGFVMQFLMTTGLAHGGPAKQDDDSVKPDVESNTNSPNTNDRKLPPVGSSGTRATSMVYTQMLFALAGDKLVFGITPDLMSWIGSGLILAGAIWVAAAKDKAGRSSSNPTPPDMDEELELQTRATSSAKDSTKLSHAHEPGPQEERLSLLTPEEVHDVIDTVSAGDLQPNEGASSHVLNVSTENSFKHRTTDN